MGLGAPRADRERDRCRRNGLSVPLSVQASLGRVEAPCANSAPHSSGLGANPATRSAESSLEPAVGVNVVPASPDRGRSGDVSTRSPHRCGGEPDIGSPAGHSGEPASGGPGRGTEGDPVLGVLWPEGSCTEVGRRAMKRRGWFRNGRPEKVCVLAPKPGNAAWCGERDLAG